MTVQADIDVVREALESLPHRELVMGKPSPDKPRLTAHPVSGCPRCEALAALERMWAPEAFENLARAINDEQLASYVRGRDLVGWVLR